MSRQAWDPHRYRADAGFVTDYGHELLALLDPRPGERVLDLGCGDGRLTRAIAARGAAVLAVDSSPAMVAAARRAGLDAELADGEALDYEAAFDAVFSNAALHWMTRPERVVAGVRRALRRGGRFVAELGGHGNIATVVDAIRATFAAHPEFGPLHLPWYFPTTAGYRSLLEAHGFAVSSAHLFARPTPLPGELAAWLAIFAAGIAADLDETATARFHEEVSERTRERLYRPGAGWTVDYVRLRVAATRIE